MIRIAAAAAILYGAWLMILLSLPYGTFDRYTDFLLTKQLVYHIRSWRFSFYIHVFVSTIVLLAGLLQFSRYLLYRKPRVHRWAGKTYAAVVLFLSGPSGMVMSFYANGRWPARTSFIILSFLWLLFTALGWQLAMKRRWSAHSHMMLRSYALTLSAITLRFYAYLLGYFNIALHPVTAYVLISWLSWTLNLLVAEWMIRSGALDRWMGKPSTIS